jgi:hypothetical protein
MNKTLLFGIILLLPAIGFGAYPKERHVMSRYFAKIFHSTNSPIVVSDNPAIDIGYQSFSFSFWFNPGSAIENYGSYGDNVIIRRMPFNPYNEYFIQAIRDGNAIKISCFLLVVGADYTVLTDPIVPDNKFHHIVWVVDRKDDGSGRIVTYVDSVLQSQSIIAPSLQESISTNRNLEIGLSGFDYGLDDVRFYRSALTAQEVSVLWNHGVGITGSGLFYGLPIPSWRMDFDVFEGDTIQGIKANGFELNGTKSSAITLVSGGIPLSISQGVTALLLADAVVETLNTGDWNLPFTAIRTTLPYYDVKELTILKVSVVPRSLDISNITRASNECLYQIDIAIQKAVAHVNHQDIHALMNLALNISKSFRGKTYPSLDAVCSKQAIDPLYQAEHIAPPSVFTTVVTLNFKVFE